ncbi:MAG: FHA domain-containing protein, partial [Cuspidothrix sp.]
DVGSSNGTYINNLPLLPGNRHRLRPGDRISLGKGDLVTFLFQLS